MKKSEAIKEFDAIRHMALYKEMALAYYELCFKLISEGIETE